jgi:N-methylhydantoinase B
LIAEANGVPGFMGTLTFAVKTIIDKHRQQGMHPGDVYVTNDPYAGGGQHLSDVALVGPIFFEDRLVAFSVNKAHWTEVGGMAPGSWTTDSTEIYQEGLQFPGILLYRRGEPIAGLIDLIAANVRTPERTLGDLYAGVASLRTAERQVVAICQRYGLETFEQSVTAILHHGEKLARRGLAELPKGTYFAEDWMDDDGLSEDPIYVCVTVSIDDESFIADFTGSAAQVRGPTNCARPRLHSACRTIFKAITDPHTPTNDGWFRPLQVICPDGTVFTAQRPAPVSTYWETGAFAVDLLWHALFPVVPERLTTGHSLSVCGTIISGTDQAGAPFILVEPQAGGWGAGATKDGESGLVVVGDGETYVMPVEVCESRYPLLVDQFTFNVGPAGAGRFRGGFGLVRDYQILSETAQLTTTFGRHKYRPWGAAGGSAGSPNGVAVIPSGASKPVLWKGKLARYPLRRGDVARMVTGVGGGYGDPAQRDPEAVREDVRNELLSAELAREVYGVVMDSGITDLETAQSLNQKLLVVDAHHDIAIDVVRRRKLGERGVLSGHWGEKLRAGGVNVQLLPLFVEDLFLPELGLRTVLEAAEAVISDLEEDGCVMRLATNAREIEGALTDGVIAGVLALEGCDGLSGDPAMLRALYRLGVRVVSFTWNRRNEFADGIHGAASAGGLSDSGKIALREMGDRGVICDVSHLAEPGFWDVASLSPAPFIASHSNARAICDHPRNLSDEQLRAVAESGGVVGLNFYGDFVHESNPTLDRLVDHLSHIVEAIGIQHAGIGPDFLEDSLREAGREAIESAGYDPAIADRWIPGCDRVERLPAFTAKLLARGFSEDEIEMVLGANFMRVFREVFV